MSLTTKLCDLVRGHALLLLFVVELGGGGLLLLLLLHFLARSGKLRMDGHVRILVVVAVVAAVTSLSRASARERICPHLSTIVV
jgi:hypothetical protein